MYDDFYGDKFKWFIGIVKDTHPDGATVKVRIFGIHRMDDITDVADDDLPRALVLMPTTGGQTGGGHSSHGLTYGTWVMGFFADGDNCQQPIIVGVVGGGDGSINNTTTNSPGAGSDFTNTNRETSVTSTSSGKQKRDIIYLRIKDLMVSFGLDNGNIHKQISGIIGNIMAECGPNLPNINVDVNDPTKRNPNSRAHGICQWNGPRRDALFRFAGTDKPTLEQQVDFMWREMNVSGSAENKALLEITRAQTVDDAVAGMLRFERPAGVWDPSGGGRVNRSHGQFKLRVQYAMQVYNEGEPQGAGG